MSNLLRSLVAGMVPLTLAVGCAAALPEEDRESTSDGAETGEIVPQQQKDPDAPPFDSYEGCYEYYYEQWQSCFANAPCRFADASCRTFFCPEPVDVIRYFCGRAPG